MRRSLIFVLFALLVAPAMGTPILTNGSFDTGLYPGGPYASLSSGSTTITGWTVGGGGVDWIGSYWQPAPGSTHSVDLSGNAPGSISQTVTNLDLNAMYRLSFSVSGNPDNGGGVRTGTVTFGSETFDFGFDTTGRSLQDMGWVTETFWFTPTATTQILTFTSTSGSPYGPAIDDVSLTAVPEPAVPALVGVLLFAMPLVRRYMK